MLTECWPPCAVVSDMDVTAALTAVSARWCHSRWCWRPQASTWRKSPTMTSPHIWRTMWRCRCHWRVSLETTMMAAIHFCGCKGSILFTTVRNKILSNLLRQSKIDYLQIVYVVFVRQIYNHPHSGQTWEASQYQCVTMSLHSPCCSQRKNRKN